MFGASWTGYTSLRANGKAASSTQDRDRTVPDSTEKSSDSAKGAAKSAALNPELAELVSNWTTLPAIIKSAILAVARPHLATGKP
jgi:hypothetical protein